MQKDPVYQHIENVPVKDTSENHCAFYRVYCRKDNMGYRVELAYGNRLELFDDVIATRKARYAVDVRNIDPTFSSVSLESLQRESRERWESLRITERMAVTNIASIGQAIKELKREYPDYPGFLDAKMAAESPEQYESSEEVQEHWLVVTIKIVLAAIGG